MNSEPVITNREELIEHIMFEQDYIGAKHSPHDKFGPYLDRSDTRRFIHFDDEANVWFVSHDDKGNLADPTESYLDAGPFTTEAEAQAVADRINEAVIEELIERFRSEIDDGKTNNPDRAGMKCPAHRDTWTKKL